MGQNDPRLSELIVSIYPSDLMDNIIDAEHWTIMTQFHFQRYYVHLFFIKFCVVFLQYMLL